MGLERCEVTGKVIHYKEQEAINELIRIKKKKPYDGIVYRCEHCKGYHIKEKE